MKPGGIPGRRRGPAGQPGLPRLTHLRALVLYCLDFQEAHGPELRQLLAASDVTMSAPGFCHLMQAMGRDGLVVCRRLPAAHLGQVSLVSHYRASIAGRKALEASMAFYESLKGG